MDPDATLALIAEIVSEYTEHRAGELADACNDLFSWLEADGFPPDWTYHPSATVAYRERLARALGMEPMGEDAVRELFEQAAERHGRGSA